MPPLRSLRREKFCQLLAADPKEDATKAALAAGYAVGSASAVRNRPDVRDRLLELRQEAAERNKVTQDQVIEEAARLAFVDIGQILDFTGPTLRLKDPSEIPEAARRALQSVKVRRVIQGAGDDAREVELTEFKLHDKRSALELVAKLIGILTEKHQHDLQGTIRHEHYDARVPLTETERANRLRAILEGSRN